MSRVYDNWEKLVGAVLDREELRRLAHCESFSTSTSSAASSIWSDFSYRDVRPIQLKEIIEATKNFGPQVYIGRGIFAEVFKAWIDEKSLTASKPGSGMAVAVRRWKPSIIARPEEWVKEIDHLIDLRHPNLVEFVAYCTEKHFMVLVYEFMQNRSLADHLFSRHRSLSWAMRIKVATDVARGLSYLHDKGVIHRDFKAATILLNEEFDAKLSNYWYGKDDHIGGSMHMVYAYGYVAPEYENAGKLTTKCNVYSFGVVLLELLSGSYICQLEDPDWAQKQLHMADWAKPDLASKRKFLLLIMDTRLDGQYAHDAAYEVAKLALQCLSSDPELRPSMPEVVVALQLL